MKWVLRKTDAIAHWLIHELTAENQLRVGVWIALASLPVYLYAPFSGEPLVIYLLSAMALTLTGITIVLSAEVLVEEENGD